MANPVRRSGSSPPRPHQMEVGAKEEIVQVLDRRNLVCSDTRFPSNVVSYSMCKTYFPSPSHLESVSVLDSSFDGSGVGRKVVTHVRLASAHELDVESRKKQKQKRKRNNRLRVYESKPPGCSMGGHGVMGQCAQDLQPTGASGHGRPGKPTTAFQR